MKTRRNCLIVGFTIMLLAGCSTTSQPELTKPKGANRVKINDDRAIVAVMGNGLKQGNTDVSIASSSSQSPQRSLVELSKLLKQYVPIDYQLQIDPLINQEASIAFTTGTQWVDVLGEPLSTAGIEVEVNFFKKTITMRAVRTPLADVIRLHLPDTLYVFTDPSISDDTPLVYDKSLHWVDALSKAAANAGIEVTTNLTKKSIYLKPMKTGL